MIFLDESFRLDENKFRKNLFKNESLMFAKHFASIDKVFQLIPNLFVLFTKFNFVKSEIKSLFRILRSKSFISAIIRSMPEVNTVKN